MKYDTEELKRPKGKVNEMTDSKIQNLTWIS